jgi:hypothetical protein
MAHSREDIVVRLKATADLLLTEMEEAVHEQLFHIQSHVRDSKMEQVVTIYMDILADAMNREHVAQTKPKARKHKAQVEMAKAKATSDAYRSRHETVNLVDFTEAWEVARQFDAGIPEMRPVDLSEDAKRAIVTLARLFVEMQREWS